MKAFRMSANLSVLQLDEASAEGVAIRQENFEEAVRIAAQCDYDAARISKALIKQKLICGTCNMNQPAADHWHPIDFNMANDRRIKTKDWSPVIIYVDSVTAAKIDPPANAAAGRLLSGYTSIKGAPTEYKIKVDQCGRWLRLWILQFSNNASHFVNLAGQRRYLKSRHFDEIDDIVRTKSEKSFAAESA